MSLPSVPPEITSNIKLWIALIGFFGVVAGALITIIGNIIIEWIRTRHKKSIDKQRQSLLKEMLSDSRFEWRNLSTLSAVIGCSEEDTKTHLIAIKARGSEKNDGKWGLISRHPLNKIN